MPLYFTDRKSESPDGERLPEVTWQVPWQVTHRAGTRTWARTLSFLCRPFATVPCPSCVAVTVYLHIYGFQMGPGWVLAVSVEYTASQSTMPRQCRVPAYYDFGDLAWVPPSQEAQGLALLSQAG